VYSTSKMLANWIAVIDDDYDLASLFKEALKISGYNVTAFTDSIKAFEHIKINIKQYELIISDYRMPSMNGLELCTNLIELNSELKVILMSSYIDFEFDIPNFICLNKPIHISWLLQIVKDSLARENTYNITKVKRKHGVIYNVKPPIL
jgi:DNA-binding NtrC family response regulator